MNGPHIGSANDGAVFRALADEDGVEVDSGYLGDQKWKLTHIWASIAKQGNKRALSEQGMRMSTGG